MCKYVETSFIEGLEKMDALDREVSYVYIIDFKNHTFYSRDYTNCKLQLHKWSYTNADSMTHEQFIKEVISSIIDGCFVLTGALKQFVNIFNKGYSKCNSIIKKINKLNNDYIISGGDDTIYDECLKEQTNLVNNIYENIHKDLELAFLK